MEDAIMTVISVLMSAAFAAAGRWIQLKPHRVVPTGHFIGANTFGAQLFRVQMAVMGIFMVFAGSFGTMFFVLGALSFGSIILGWVGMLIAIVAGIVAAVYVRREVKKHPVHVSESPLGWWP